MDRDDFEMIGLLATVVLAMYLGDKVFPMWKDIIFFGMIGGVVVFVVVSGWYEEHLVAPFAHFDATLRPGNRRLSLFFTVDAGATKRLGHNRYATTLRLGFPVKLPRYGKVDRIIVHHDYPFTSRAGFGEGNALFRGHFVKHHSHAKVTFWEPMEGSFDVDHGVPIPIYELIEAPLDYNHGMRPVGSVPAQATAGKNCDSCYRLAEAERKAMHWHQEAVHLGEVVTQKTNELLAVLKAKGDFDKSVTMRMLSIRREQQTIENALGAKSGARIGNLKWLGPVIIFLGILAYIQLNPDAMLALQLWLANPWNQWFAIIVLGIVASLAYYNRRRRAD